MRRSGCGAMRWAVPVFELMISARCVPDERAARLECADLPTLSGVYAWVRSPTFHVALATGCATPGPAVIADAEEFASAGHWFESKVFPAASDAGARSSRVVVTGKITLQDDRRSADHDVASFVAPIFSPSFRHQQSRRHCLRTLPTASEDAQKPFAELLD